MNDAYCNLVTKTFCDDSIRSVMMIDDKYQPYSACIKRLDGLENFQDDPEGLNEFLGESRRASQISKFFHDKKIMSDISNDSEYVDIEKIRKCDLLLLDYHLEHEDPVPSLKVLKQLKDSRHMNLVVVYTSEGLDKVWKEIACSLRGNIDTDTISFDDQLATEAWDGLTNYGASLSHDIQNLVSPSEEIAHYILKKKFTRDTTRALAEILSPNIRDFLGPVGEWSVSEYNKLQNNDVTCDLKGEPNQWLRIGNVFIALCAKTAGDDSESLWESLVNSLHSWEPNYYRLITSQIQNHIEDQNIAMDSFLEQDYETQAAWLWKLQSAKLNDELSTEYSKLCTNIYEGLLDTLLSDEELYDFSSEVFTHSIGAVDEGVTDDALIDQCKEHTSSNLKTDRYKVVHALNQYRSSKQFLKKHLTVGSVIRPANGNQQVWYLCVSPSCDVVPKQHTTASAKRIEPDRLVKFFKLSRVNNLQEPLNSAATGKYLFLTDENNNRIALSVLDNITDLPAIDLGIVRDHDEGSIDPENIVKISFLGEEDKEFHVVAQLRDYYAARYQALASHNEGRVGVDFFNYTSS